MGGTLIGRIESKWVPYNKGGEYRKWFGNNTYYVLWENDGKSIKGQKNSCIRGERYYFKEGITWSDITSSKNSFKFFPQGHLFDAKGPSAFFNEQLQYYALAFLNSKVVEVFSKLLNPTLSFQIGDFRNLPFYVCEIEKSNITDQVSKILIIASSDWNSYENSWSFEFNQLCHAAKHNVTLKSEYNIVRQEWKIQTNELNRLEEINNQFFIEKYGFQNELSPEVPLSEISLTCNPYYRYSGNKTEAELEALLLADTMREFISYSVGCMFGRYSFVFNVD